MLRERFLIAKNTCRTTFSMPLPPLHQDSLTMDQLVLPCYNHLLLLIENGILIGYTIPYGGDCNECAPLQRWSPFSHHNICSWECHTLIWEKNNIDSEGVMGAQIA